MAAHPAYPADMHGETAQCFLLTFHCSVIAAALYRPLLPFPIAHCIHDPAVNWAVQSMLQS
jgi:hypothetical protein